MALFWVDKLLVFFWYPVPLLDIVFWVLYPWLDPDKNLDPLVITGAVYLGADLIVFVLDATLVDPNEVTDEDLKVLSCVCLCDPFLKLLDW